MLLKIKNKKINQSGVALGEVVTYNLSVAGQTSLIIMAALFPHLIFQVILFYSTQYCICTVHAEVKSATN